jgi:transcriptional regulator with XRE-family HTH domain
MSDIRDQRSNRFAQLLGLELKANFAREETSQAEVAERLGHSKSGYSRWLNAKPSMPLEVLLNTCELIGVDPRTIVDSAYRRLIEEMGEYSAGSPSIDISQLPAEERADLAVERFTRDQLTAAANKDPNKEREMEGDAHDF